MYFARTDNPKGRLLTWMFFRRLGYLPALTHHTMCIAFLSCNYKSILLKITVCPFIDIFSTLYPYSVSSFLYYRNDISPANLTRVLAEMLSGTASSRGSRIMQPFPYSFTFSQLLFSKWYPHLTKVLSHHLLEYSFSPVWYMPMNLIHKTLLFCLHCIELYLRYE